MKDSSTQSVLGQHSGRGQDRRVAFSDRWIKAKIKNPPAEREEWSDTSERGLKLRIYPTGRAVFGAKPRVDGRQQWQDFGEFHETERTLAHARRWAAKVKVAAHQGTNMTRAAFNERERQRREDAERAAAEANSRTVRQLVDEYEPHLKRRNKSWALTINVLKLHVVPRLHDRALTSLTKADAIELLDYLERDRGFTRQVDQVRQSFGGALDYAIEHSYIPEGANIMWQVKPRKLGGERSRILTPDELRRVWEGAGDLGETGGAHVQLSILLATRRDELRLAKRSEIDHEERLLRIPAARHKSARGIEIPLSDAALKIIDSLPASADGFLFSNGKGGPWASHAGFKRKLDERTGIPDWRLHDLRRTARSLWSRLGIPFEVRELMLGHVLPGGKLTRTYDRHDYRDEIADGFRKWAEYVALLTSPARRASNVAELAAKR